MGKNEKVLFCILGSLALLFIIALAIFFNNDAFLTLLGQPINFLFDCNGYELYYVRIILVSICATAPIILFIMYTKSSQSSIVEKLLFISYILIQIIFLIMAYIILKDSFNNLYNKVEESNPPDNIKTTSFDI